MAHIIMTSLIGPVTEGSEKRGWEGEGMKREGGEDVFVLQTKDKFCSSAGTNEEPDEGILRSESFPHCFLFK